MEKESEVLALRAKGLTPKQIAKNLGLKVSQVGEIVRASAEQETLARKERGELAPIAQCYVNTDCRQRLLENREESSIGGGERGLATVCVARTTGHERYEVCTYLVDYWCLGLKDTIGLKKFNGTQYREFLEMVYEHYDSYQQISFTEAQAIVWGSIEYAKTLGIKPHRDFEQTKAHLGEWKGEMQLKFGRDGKPFYFQGPYDNKDKIFKALRESVGDGNFDYVLVMEGF
jgi:hypothetical protein